MAQGHAETLARLDPTPEEQARAREAAPPRAEWRAWWPGSARQRASEARREMRC
jgi:hypothetical protein